MKVFISWSGERSKIMASLLSQWLPDMFQDLETWMSAHDLDAGLRWGNALNEQLEATNLGIICMTPENINAPWLLFEAGSLSKRMSQSRVIPYLLHLSATDVPFPLAQFQGVSASKDGTYKLLKSINEVRNPIMEDERLRRLFEKWWPDLESALAKIPSSVPVVAQQRTDRALLEEILQLVRQRSAETYGKQQEISDPDNWSVRIFSINEDVYPHLATPLLESYLKQLETSWNSTNIPGKENALERIMNAVKKELASRSAADASQESDKTA